MQVFSLFVHTAKSLSPKLMMEIVSDWPQVRTLAEQAVAVSNRRLAVEVRQDDRLVFSLDRNGVVWCADQP